MPAPNDRQRRAHPGFLTVAEIAAVLKVNAQTVRNWIDRGELPAVRVGALAP